MISNTTIKASYAGNGLTRQFSIPFEYTSTSQIYVALNEEDEETVLDSDDFAINTGSGVVIYPKSVDDPPIGVGVTLSVYTQKE